jgi:hypothetical protein
VSFDWNAFSYKVVAFFETFPMICRMPILKHIWDDCDYKKFWNTCSPRELGPFLREQSCPQGEGELSCLGEQLKPFFPRNNHMLEEKELFVPWEYGCSSEQFKPFSFESMVVPQGTT